jgi:predicted DNA-binding transcriptional regulator AlpA
MTVETSDKLLLCATEAAALCGVSRSLWWSMHSAGKVPLPIRLSRRTLWRADELRNWTRADCPSRERWEQIKGTQNV